VRVVGNPSEWWSPRDVVDLLVDVESGEHRYVVLIPGHGRATIVARDGVLVAASAASGEELLSELPSF
jgi:hypothetical protein